MIPVLKELQQPMISGISSTFPHLSRYVSVYIPDARNPIQLFTMSSWSKFCPNGRDENESSRLDAVFVGISFPSRYRALSCHELYDQRSLLSIWSMSSAFLNLSGGCGFGPSRHYLQNIPVARGWKRLLAQLFFDHHEPTMGERSRWGNPDHDPKSGSGFLNIPAHRNYWGSGSQDLLD